MFYSQCLLSSKGGPLGAIWVAAYFFKKLKKAQVTETDISSSVDKILQDELNVFTYRVLAYLLLGVVRVYSKKVEYLFDDCHKVLVKINDFVVSTKDTAQVETLRAPFFSITLPERFELDAFDLEILDDVIGGNVVPREEITLKDGAWKNEGIGQYSFDKYHFEEIAVFGADFTLADNLLLGPMDIDVELSTLHDLTNLEAQTENPQHKRFSQAECVELETFCEVEEEPTDPVESLGEDHQTEGEQIKVPVAAPFEDKIPGEASTGKHQDSRLSQEGCVNLETFCCTGGESLDYVSLSGEGHQIDGEQIKILELGESENKMQRVITKTFDLCDLETSTEKLQVDKFSQGECMDLDTFCGANEESLKLVRQYNAGHHKESESIKFPTLTSSENRKCQINIKERPPSIMLDGTPPSKFPDASVVSTPEFIPTPAARERARISRKRKCLIDETVVLPNALLRQSIHDASNLVSKRRKTPRNALAAWKASRMSILPQGFLEPLIPCTSSELRSLFYTTKLKILESAATMDKPKKLDMPESPSVGGSEQIAESSTVNRSGQIALAPETPVKHPTSMRSFESPNDAKIPNSEGVRPASSFGSVEQEPEPSPCKDQELDLCLMNEEIYSCGAENVELYGWSGRTRTATRCLHKNFLNRKKGREEEVVSLLRILEGRTKKESARLFYEILVLRTTGYLDGKQDNAYGDIQVWKLPKGRNGIKFVKLIFHETLEYLYIFIAEK